MSLIHTEFYSRTLAGQSHFYAVLPNDAPPFPENPNLQRPPKTLILLHGYSGCESDWITGSSIRELPCEMLRKNIACQQRKRILSGNICGR